MSKIPTSEIEKAISIAEKQLAVLPEGTLEIHGNQFYSKVNGQRHFIPASKKAFAQQLAQRQYNKLFIIKAKRELANRKKVKKATNLGALYDNLNPIRRELVKPILISDKEYAKRWQTQKYEKNKDRPTNGLYITNRKEEVRSKSEMLIANKLNEMKIPYLYEKPLLLDTLVIHPDFTILNVKTREEIILEHFGKMDDPKYRESTWWKIRKYAENGFILGKNLIMTFEESEYPINMWYFEKLVEQYLGE